MKLNLSFTSYDKRILVGCALVFLMGLAFLLTLPSLIDLKAIETELKSNFKKATGLDLEIQDGMRAHLFPYPYVTIHNLYVSNVPGAASSFLVSVHQVVVTLNTTSLVSSHPRIKSLVADGVVVELEKLKNGHMNWQEAAHFLSKSSGDSAAAETKDSPDNMNGLLEVINEISKIYSVKLFADIHFTDSQEGYIINYSDLVFNMENGKQSKYDLSIALGDIPIKITAETGELGEAFKQKATTAKIALDSGETHLNYEGEIKYADSLMLHGTTSFDTKNIVSWINLMKKKEGSAVSKPISGKPIPLTFSSDVTTEGGNIVFPEIKLGGGVFGGKLKASLLPPFQWDIKGALDTMDLDSIVASGIFAVEEGEKSDGKKKKKKSDNAAEATINTTKSIWSYFNFGVDLRVATLPYNKNTIKNAHFQFDLGDGEMTISQISASLPGESKVIFTGIGKQGYQGFMLDGQLDGSGENFIDMASIFRASGSGDFLTKDFKRFRFKTNFVVSAVEMRFTELTARIENMAFVGGVITTFGDDFKVQTAVRIAGIDMDKFAALWGVNQYYNDIVSDSFGKGTTERPLVTWIKNLGYSIDIRASLEQYTILSKQMDKCKFRVLINKNKLDVSEIEMSIGDTQVVGKTVIDFSKQIPLVSADLSADTLDVTPYVKLDNFFLEDDPLNAKKDSGKNWSHRGINFDWLDHVNAEYRFKLGQLKAGDVEAIGLDTRGSVGDRSFNIPAFSVQVNGTQLSGKAVIKGGKIPSLSMSGDIVGLDVGYITSYIPVLKGMSGKYNAHYRLTTSGIDIYTWIYNTDGGIALAGRDVTVEGFNLPAIISAVSYVRTVADILDAVKRAYPGGSTLFTAIDGEWTLGNGIFKTPSIKLKSEFATGEFSGQVDIINWKMVGNLTLSLVYLDRVNTPKMTIIYNGNLNNVEKELDTRLLEQYVANKTSERLLHQADPN